MQLKTITVTLWLIACCYLPFAAAAPTHGVSLLEVSVESGTYSFLQPRVLVDVAARNQFTLIVELDLGKLHIFERQPDNRFTLVRTMNASIGKEGYGKQVEGDNKTPVGIYRIVSHLTNGQLDDFYGNAAYPVNYPNAWDKLQQRTGHGIWLHAEPVGSTEKTRPLRDSNGCVVLSNNDIDALKQYLEVGHTYVVLTPKMTMAPVAAVTELRNTLRQQLDGWRTAWENIAPDPYLNYYSKDFNNLDKDWAAWTAYKKRLHRGKTYIDVDISDLGIYAYPGEDDLLWVEFYQYYRSNNYLSKGWKRQLWALEEDDNWRIIYEHGG